MICLAANGSRVHDIVIENISETDCKERRESVVKIYTGYGSRYKPGDIFNIFVKNVSAVYADYGVCCNAQVENVTLEHITHRGGGKALQIDSVEGVIVKE